MEILELLTPVKESVFLVLHYELQSPFLIIAITQKVRVNIWALSPHLGCCYKFAYNAQYGQQSKNFLRAIWEQFYVESIFMNATADVVSTLLLSINCWRSYR